MARRSTYPDGTVEHILSEAQWRARAGEHAERVDALTAGWRSRRRSGEKHPVDDFLFTYYPTRPARLRRWHPGFGTALEGDVVEFRSPWYRTVRLGSRDVTVLDDRRVAERFDTVTWVDELLRATRSRAPQLGCAGLHEWAMVYGQSPEQVRHADRPLRVDPAVVRETIDSVGLRCTHFDAYRFFTTDAVPLNPVPLTRADVVTHEQPGCLHANMDLYRHALALSPVVSSELLLAAFELARDLRALDMRGAPYDLRVLGYEPIPVETPAGRAEFARQQQLLASRAAVVRSRLLTELELVITTLGPAAA